MPGTVDVTVRKAGVISVLMEFSHCKTDIQEMPIFLIVPQRQCGITVKGAGSGARLPEF